MSSAYPDSADARYNLADAYSRVGDLSSWSDTDERRSEIRSAVQQTLKKLGTAH
jgi:hypothetical protein